MEKKTFLEKANLIADEINSTYVSGGKFNLVTYNNTTHIEFTTKQGRVKRLANNLSGKQAWITMCAIGNYFDVVSK